MFPLGSVLLPSLLLPLHVFEPRYREMARHCLDGDREFGVVLIERGSEVGGHDVRTDVGTVARILDASELDDGRWVIGAVGTRRIRIREWLRDDPYPRADIEDWPDVEPGPDVHRAYIEVVGVLRRVLALKAELAEPAADATVELVDQPLIGSYQATAVAPIGPLDQQRLLAESGPDTRLATLRALLEEEEAFLHARIAMR